MPKRPSRVSCGMWVMPSTSRALVGCQIFDDRTAPDGWACVPLGERIELAYGSGLREEDREPGHIDVYGSNGVVGRHTRALVAGPGILVGRKGTIGAVHYATGPFWPIDTVYHVLPRCGDNLQFVRHLLDYLPLERLNAATGVPGLSRRDAYSLLAVFPPPDEQAAIARILDAVDTALERTRDAAKRAHNLLASIVVDILDRGVGGNGRFRCPREAPSAFAVTALGRLPRDWRLSTVGDEFDVQSGFTLNSRRRPRLQKRRYLRVANVQRDLLDLSDVQELEAKDDEFALRILAPDDLVVVEGHADSMEIGRCARVTEDAAGMTFQNHLFRLRPGTAGEITAGFACMWLNSNYAKRFWNARCATSSGLHTINQRTLKQLALPVPSPSEQRDITAIVEQCQRLRDAINQKLTKLQALKESLMHDLFTGKVRVGDATEAPAP